VNSFVEFLRDLRERSEETPGGMLVPDETVVLIHRAVRRGDSQLRMRRRVASIAHRVRP